MTKNDIMYLNGVEQTMLLPLWGRYSEYKKSTPLIRDEKCVEIVEKLAVDFKSIEQQQHPLTRLAWVARAWNTDQELSRLIMNEQEVTVVSLGCGLDTAFFRCSHSNLHWYDFDLPKVIALRKRLLGTTAGCTMIAGSVLDSEKFSQIKVRGKLVVLALGLLCYFNKNEVRQVISNIAGLADNALIIMDYFSKKGIEIGNKLVLQNSKEARMIWYADSEEDLLALHPSIRIKDAYPLFQNLRPQLTAQERSMSDVSDQQRINSMAILSLEHMRSD